jgi:hypothetical protein
MTIFNEILGRTPSIRLDNYQFHLDCIFQSQPMGAAIGRLQGLQVDSLSQAGDYLTECLNGSHQHLALCIATMQKMCELLTQPDPEKNIIATPDQLPLWDQLFAERNYIVLNTQLITSLNQAVSDYNLYELDDQLNTAKAIALTAQFFFKKELSTIRSLLHQSLIEEARNPLTSLERKALLVQRFDYFEGLQRYYSLNITNFPPIDISQSRAVKEVLVEYLSKSSPEQPFPSTSMETDKDVPPVSKRGHEGGNDSARLRRRPLDGNSD